MGPYPRCINSLYYISDSIFSIFREIEMVVSLGKIFLSDEEVIPFERYNAS